MAYIPLVITVAMGIMAGGMVALAMIGPRHTQNIYGILALFGLVLGLTAVIVGPHPVLAAAFNSLFNLVLAAFVGYAVTTVFVLSYQVKPDFLLPDVAAVQAAQAGGSGKTAVLYYVPAESEQYNVRSATRGIETIDYPQALPPTLLRPLYLLDLKRKYEVLKHNPYRALHFRLAQKVQDRLGKRYKVYIAFYNDHPTLNEAAVEAIRNGSRRLIVLHARLTNPPPSVRTLDTLESLRPIRYGVGIVEAGPLWNSELLPRLFVRRALAATEGLDRSTIGLILIGQGHPLPRGRLPDGSEAPDPLLRQNQELTFEKRVRQALIRAGFADDNVVLAWLHWQHPTIPAAYAQLVAEGCQRIFWIGSGFMTDSVATLYEIPRLVESAAGPVEISSLGPWNDDDIVAEALVEKVKQVAAVEQLI